MTKETFSITVNGEIVGDVRPGFTVKQLLARLELPVGKIAVERNREIVPKSTFGGEELSPGDVLEIIHFIGGG